MPYLRRTSKTWENKEGAVPVMYLGGMEYMRGKKIRKRSKMGWCGTLSWLPGTPVEG